MKTYTINKILCLIFLVAVLSSCGTKKANYTNAIPKNVQMITAINFESLSEKSNFKEADYKFKDMINSQLNNDSPELAKIIEAAEKDAASIGIDIGEEVYIFVYGEKTKYFAGLCKLTDASKFEKMIEEIVKRLGLNVKVSHEGDINYILNAENANAGLISWNNDFSLIIGDSNPMDSTDILAEVKRLYGQKSSESAQSMEMFQMLTSKESDIAYGLDFSLYSELMKSNMATQDMPIPLNMNNIYGLMEGTSMVSHVNFNVGEIRSDVEYLFGDKMKEMMDKYPIAKNFDNTVLPLFFPNKALGLISLGMNFKNYYGFVKELFGPGIFSMVEMGLKSQMGIKMDDLLNTIKGDILITFADLTAIGKSVKADVNMAFSLRDGKLNDKLTSILSMAAQKGENYFTLNLQGKSIYLAMNDQLIMATTNMNTADAFAKGGLAEFSLNESELNEKMAKFPAFMFLDIESILKLAPVQRLINNPLISGNPAANDLISLFKSIEYQGNIDPPTGTGIMKLNTEKNALRAILEGIDKIAQ